MDLIESYREELQLFRKPWTRIWVGALIAGLFLLPWFPRQYVPEHVTYIATIICIYSIGAIGQNLLIGYTGQISFGQAGSWPSVRLHSGTWRDSALPWPITLVGAGLTAGIFGVIVGFPLSRLKGLIWRLPLWGSASLCTRSWPIPNSSPAEGWAHRAQTAADTGPLQMSCFNYYFNLIIALIFALIAYNIISSYMVEPSLPFAIMTLPLK